MEKRRVKIQKTSYKNLEAKETVSWSDLPQDISVLILQKLPHLVDLIRFRVVCKNWRIPKDRMVKYKDHHRLPWLCRLYLVTHSNILVCKITDPADSGNVFKSSKSVKGLGSPCFGRSITVYGSEQGWLIAGCRRIKAKNTSIFMYHPYSKVYISLSRVGCCPSFATLSCNPVLRDGTLSRNCQVFLICNNGVHSYIASYRLQDKKWKVGPVGAIIGKCYGMQYIKEQLFCLFLGGTLTRYNLEDESWTLIGNPWGLRINCYVRHLWMIKCKGDILVACIFELMQGRKNICSTLYFDWSIMSWVEYDLTVNMDIIICDKLAMVRPFVEDSDCANTKDCRVFLCSTPGQHIRDLLYECYSLVKGKMTCLDFFRFDITDFNIMDTVFSIEPPPIN